MLNKYKGMSDRARWVIYHRICDEWVAENQPFDEQRFHQFVRSLTKDMGL
jgi:hypothetical protein